MELKPIERTDREVSRLNAAMRIYKDTILPEAQNPERQIAYWIDHNKDLLCDEFRCFSLNRGRKVIGYLQYSYFSEENIIFFEYLCIKDEESKGLINSNALKEIENYIVSNYRPNFTIVIEVAHEKSSDGTWIPDRRLSKYFEYIGFRRLEFNYEYPVLQSYDGALSYPADLMVLLPQDRVTLSSSELRTILRCLYFKHYLRWDRPFLDSKRFAEREELMNSLYNRLVMNISDDDTFKTFGGSRRIGAFRGTAIVSLRKLLRDIFGATFVKLGILAALMLLFRNELSNDFLLIPFLLMIIAFYCVLENTASSQKLLMAIISKVNVFRLPS